MFSQITISQNCGQSPNSQMHTWNSLQLISFSCLISLTILASFILEKLFHYCRKEQFHRTPKRTKDFHLESSKDLLLINLPKIFLPQMSIQAKDQNKKTKPLWLCRDANSPLKKQRSQVYINM